MSVSVAKWKLNYIITLETVRHAWSSICMYGRLLLTWYEPIQNNDDDSTGSESYHNDFIDLNCFGVFRMRELVPIV